MLGSVASPVETILFDPGFIPTGIRNNCPNTFSACKIICLNPVPFPFPLHDFQPSCTGSAVLWVRRYVQMGIHMSNWGFVVCSNQSMLVAWSLASFFRLMVTRVLSIASKCSEFITSICLHCIPISENIHLFGLLFVFPEPLDRVWTQLCTSGCFWLYFLLWKKFS